MQKNSNFKSYPFYSTFICGTISLLAFASQARAVTVYDEGVNGDFSNSGLAPTSVTISPGINDIFGTTGKSDAGVVDRDYFTFNVPSGYDLVAIAVLDGTKPLGNLSFFGVQTGSEVTVSPTSLSADGLLGYVHYNAANGDILPDLGIAKSPNPPGTGSSTGFTPPLGAGDYAFWVQETATGTSPYGFAFQIEKAVPEGGPGLAGVAGAIGSLLAFGRRRQSA